MQVIETTLGDLASLSLDGFGVVVAMPSIDSQKAIMTARFLARRAGVKGGAIVVIHDTARRGFVVCANQAFRCSAAPLFAYVAEDAYPGRGWLQRGIAALQKNQRGLLGFSDGKWHGGMAAFGLVSAEWAAKNYEGDLFYPGYCRHYADAELTVLALADRQYAYDPHALLVEVDFAKDEMPVDSTDRALYRSRAATSFGGRVTNPALINYIA